MCAAYINDGRQLATGGQDGTARVWDMISGDCIALMQVWLHAWRPEAKRLDRALLDHERDDFIYPIMAII